MIRLMLAVLGVLIAVALGLARRLRWTALRDALTVPAGRVQPREQLQVSVGR